MHSVVIGVVQSWERNHSQLVTRHWKVLNGALANFEEVLWLICRSEDVLPTLKTAMIGWKWRYVCHRSPTTATCILSSSRPLAVNSYALQVR